ncbi:MAG: AAA family ATPase [Ignavibacterium sp.]|nr:AAA family ATPase [Ignavibacterium sp.]
MKENLKLVSANEIQKMELPPINWIIKDLLPEGLALLAGRPKVGKSWLSSQLALASSAGAQTMDYFDTQKSKVLYIALEDNFRRLKDRINTMLKDGEASSDLFFLDQSEFRRFHLEGIKMIRQAVDQNEDLNLIIIDTLGNAISKDQRKFGLSFQDEYDFMAELQNIALQNQLCILLIHHTRKSEADSVFDEIVGTSGITAAPDTLLILKKHSNGYILHVTGRDVKEENYLLTQDEETHRWIVMDKNIISASTVERQEIIELFGGQYDLEIRVGQMAERLQKSRESISQLLRKMLLAGEIIKGSKTGLYKLPSPN